MFDAFAELFEECNSTTINLRILWSDKVLPVLCLGRNSVPAILIGNVSVPHNGLRTHQIHIQFGFRKVLARAYTKGDGVGPSTYLIAKSRH